MVIDQYYEMTLKLYWMIFLLLLWGTPLSLPYVASICILRQHMVIWTCSSLIKLTVTKVDEKSSCQTNVSWIFTCKHKLNLIEKSTLREQSSSEIYFFTCVSFFCSMMLAKYLYEARINLFFIQCDKHRGHSLNPRILPIDCLSVNCFAGSLLDPNVTQIWMHGNQPIRIRWYSILHFWASAKVKGVSHLIHT